MQGPPHPSQQRFHQHPRGHQHAPLRPQLAKSAVATKPTKAYNPRHSERTLRYRTVAEHFETWLELASAGQFDGQGDHRTPPAYVEKAFRKYLECGIFAHGFARVHCDDCGDDFLVAFSCKGRGVCPSYNTPRMAEAAAHLSDHVFPRMPVRQWALSVPKRLRYCARPPFAMAGSSSAALIWSTAAAKGTQSHCSATSTAVNWCSRHWS